jgi:hypothetical protein
MLTKSDFTATRQCDTQLYYRKLGFPRVDKGPFMEMLAHGGFAVGKLAQIMHPGGFDLSAMGTDAAVQRTQELLARDEVVVYEAAVQHGHYLARIDVLVKQGNEIQLIEVKSAGYDPAEPKIDAKYIEDVAFQTMIARQAWPHCHVEPFLMMTDKTSTATVEGMTAWFVIGQDERGRVQVEFTGDEDVAREARLLVAFPVADRVNVIMGTVTARAQLLAGSLFPQLQRIEPARQLRCNKCDYRNASPDDPEMDGFRQCWQHLADVQPSVLDLHQAGNIDRFRGQVISTNITNGLVSIMDVPDEALDLYNGRPLMQKNRRDEWISDDLRQEVAGWEYPLHFIDFETTRLAIPPHAGLRPYEQVIFQWSCHTIAVPGAEPVHTEWLNTNEHFPNFTFARALRTVLGDHGTVLMWSAHEKTALRDIAGQLGTLGEEDDELAAWLRNLEGRLVDMDALARRGYFHPSTNARTSIKVTLPAVLQEYAGVRLQTWLGSFEDGLDLYQRAPDGALMDPYKLLPMADVLEEYQVNEGGMAMRAYLDMLYGRYRNDAQRREALATALKRYCKLDTLAMVIIWEHWRL